MNTFADKNKNMGQIKITIAVFLIVIFLICGFLFKIMIIDGQELKRLSIAQSYREVMTEPKRGSIYDRNGIPLAVSIDVYSFAIDPLLARNDRDLHNKLAVISQILDIEMTQLVESVNRQNRFVWIKRFLEDDQAQALREVRLRGALFFEESKRVYPKGQFLSGVLGFVGQDNKGLEGLELFYDDILKGTAGKILIEEDSKGRGIQSSIYQIVPSKDGLDIYLTIDQNIQYITERSLFDMAEELRAEKGLAIVYDVLSGEIIAMASYPSFDPNNYGAYPLTNHRNIPLHSVYEPGSTFKPFVAAMAVEEAKVGLTEIFNCESSIRVLNYNIREIIYPRGYGQQTLVQALQNSSNSGYVQIGQRVGRSDFYKYLHGFGLTERTGVDLPGERQSNIIPQNRATILDISVSSIGQGNAFTPFQMLRSFSAVVADGKLMKPYIMLRAEDRHGNIIIENEPEISNIVLSANTSAVMREALNLVVEEGTGRRARVDGFHISGKTGTAQKASPDGGYIANEVVTSFMGFAPLNNPRFAALVMFDSPQKFKNGSQTAAPVFREIIEKTLDYYQIAPENLPEEFLQSRSGNTETMRTVGRYAGRYLSEIDDLQNHSAMFIKVGEGSYVVAQFPFANELVSEQTKISLYLSEPEKNEIIVPDLTGMTIVEASQLLDQLGLIIKVNGSGFAQSQLPSAGSVIRKDTIVQVVFSNRGERGNTQ